MKTIEQILTIADFLGNGMTDEQAIKLVEEIQKLTPANRDVIYEHIDGRLWDEIKTLGGMK